LEIAPTRAGESGRSPTTIESPLDVGVVPLDLTVAPKLSAEDDRGSGSRFDLASRFQLVHGRLHQLEPLVAGIRARSPEAETEVRALRIVDRPELVRVAVEAGRRRPGGEQRGSVAGLAKRKPGPPLEVGVLAPGGPRVLER